MTNRESALEAALKAARMWFCGPHTRTIEQVLVIIDAALAIPPDESEAVIKAAQKLLQAYDSGDITKMTYPAFEELRASLAAFKKLAGPIEAQQVIRRNVLTREETI